jgi:molecular chaperone GrpE
VLDQNGLKEINPIGQIFDANIHEAISYEKVEDKKNDHTILTVIERGYKLGDKLIRPAKVIVAEAKE